MHAHFPLALSSAGLRQQRVDGDSDRAAHQAHQPYSRQYVNLQIWLFAQRMERAFTAAAVLFTPTRAAEGVFLAQGTLITKQRP